MKQIITLFIVVVFYSFTLVGCNLNRTTEVTTKQKFFEATILSINTESLLVEPDEGTAERNSSDQIEIRTSLIGEENSILYLSRTAIGDKIRIGYLDTIKESYPAQINQVFLISLIESGENVQ